MNKRRKIREKLKMLDQHLAAAKNYVANNVNVQGSSWLHLGDWKGKSGHPLWTKNHMIPSTERARKRTELALERIEKRGKEKSRKQRRRANTNA